MKPKTTHAQDISQRINIDVAVFMSGKENASIDEVNGFNRLPYNWKENSDIITEEIRDYIKEDQL